MYKVVYRLNNSIAISKAVVLNLGGVHSSRQGAFKK